MIVLAPTIRPIMIKITIIGIGNSKVIGDNRSLCLLADGSRLRPKIFVDQLLLDAKYYIIMIPMARMTILSLSLPYVTFETLDMGSETMLPPSTLTLRICVPCWGRDICLSDQFLFWRHNGTYIHHTTCGFDSPIFDRPIDVPIKHSGSIHVGVHRAQQQWKQKLWIYTDFSEEV